MKQPNECSHWFHCDVNNHDPQSTDCEVCTMKGYEIRFDVEVTGSVYMPAHSEREVRKKFKEYFDSYYRYKEHITHGLKNPKIYEVIEEEVEDGSQEG